MSFPTLLHVQILRIWRRRLVGGAAVAALTPLAILVASLTVGLASGGLGSVGALGQALTGPAVPTIEREAPSRRSRDARRLLERSLPRMPARAARADRGASWVTSPGVRGDRPERAKRAPGGGGDQPAPAPAPPAEQPGPRPPDGPPETGPVRQIGDRVKAVTDDVPVAGAPAGSVVDTIVDTIESLPLPRSAQLP